MTTYEGISTVTGPVDATTSVLLPFEEVYRLHADAIYRFCLAQTRSPHAAEDACGDVFTAAYVAYARVRPSADAVRFWLLRIARNTIVSRWRVRVRHARLVRVIGERPSPRPEVEQMAEVREDLRTALAALTQLRRRDRLLISLRIAGLSYSEVAEMLGTSEGAARVATHRALRALRMKLEEC